MTSVQNWEQLNTRAVTAYQQGWHSEAASLGEDTLVLAEEIFGRDHLNTSESLKNLAFICFAQAKDADAALLEQTLKTRDGKALPSESPEESESLHSLVLLNFAKSKYSRAESLLNRALKIKKNALGPDHPDVLETIGNLAAVYDSQGSHGQAKALLRSVRSRDAFVSIRIGIGEAEESSKGFIEAYENRTQLRHSCHFPVRITKGGVDTAIRGVTENLSQNGAFIRTRELSAFKVNDKVALFIFIPSLFSAGYKSVGMQGTGVITRVKEENQGIAVQFRTSFKQFERVGEIEIPEKAQYKKLVHYLSELEDKAETQFLAEDRVSFLVEKAEIILDTDVLLHFGTREFDGPVSLKEIDKVEVHPGALEARVIEISQRQIDSNHGVVTVGRSTTNDIVLYNKSLSKSHAFLFFLSTDENPYLVDLGSTNGTSLNDEKMVVYKMYRLQDGDEISFGPQTKVIYQSARGFYDLLNSMKGL